MGKVAFIFPGQGAQYIGMGKEISEYYKESAQVFDEATEALGYDTRELIFFGDEEKLKITENTQPAILTASIACLMPLLKENITPDFVSGLSLGEYSAHVAAGTFSFKDAVKLVRKRGQLMQNTVPIGVGGMAAILGLENQKVIDICDKASEIGVVEPANFNCPGQVVVAGEIKAVEKAIEIAQQEGAKRAIMLPVSAPFHSSMLKKAGEELDKEFENVKINDIKIPLVTNVTGEVVSDSSKVREQLVNQVSSAIYWEQCVKTMIDNGVDTFVEIGPGKVLCGFIKKIDRKLNTLNIEDLESLNKAIDFLKGC